MIRRSFTAVIEKNTTWTAGFETEPYETGWAGEARWFIRVVAMEGTLSVTPQISPDGLFWCDEGRAPLLMGKPGLSLRPARFWRLAAAARRCAGAGRIGEADDPPGAQGVRRTMKSASSARVNPAAALSTGTDRRAATSAHCTRSLRRAGASGSRLASCAEVNAPMLYKVIR